MEKDIESKREEQNMRKRAEKEDREKPEGEETSNYADYQTKTDSPSAHTHIRKCKHREKMNK